MRAPAALAGERLESANLLLHCALCQEAVGRTSALPIIRLIVANDPQALLLR